jgi:hypothetical protein
MNAGQAVAIARDWVEQHGRLTPGFCGAHLMGGLTQLPPDAPFPAYNDIDLNLVVTEGPGGSVNDISYQGQLLEYGTVQVARYQSAEAVLADVELASNLAANSIIADPTGMLAELHAIVAPNYARRQWVTARCDGLKAAIRRNQANLGQAGSANEALLNLLFVALDLGGLVAVSALRPPTHRRTLCVLRDALAEFDITDLHEATLAALGFANFSSADAAACLRQAAQAFDLAVAVNHTSVPFGWKLHPYVRAYNIDGSQVMLDEGCHREAMAWIAPVLLIAFGAIQADASEPDRRASQFAVDQLAARLGLDTAASRAARRQQVDAVVERVFQAADDIVCRNPAVLD